MNSYSYTIRLWSENNDPQFVKVLTEKPIDIVTEWLLKRDIELVYNLNFQTGIFLSLNDVKFEKKMFEFLGNVCDENTESKEIYNNFLKLKNRNDLKKYYVKYFNVLESIHTWCELSNGKNKINLSGSGNIFGSFLKKEKKIKDNVLSISNVNTLKLLLL